jgi:hypothetical protein
VQAPAVTCEYQAALLQLVRSSDQEIAQRKASLQRLMRNAFSPSCALSNRRMQKPSPPRSIAAGYGIAGIGRLEPNSDQAGRAPRWRLLEAR